MHKIEPFQALINSSVFGVFIYQEEGKIVFTNKRFAQMLEYDPEELIGKSIIDFLPQDEVDIEEIKNLIRMHTQGKHFPFERSEHYFKTKTNASIPVSVFAYTVEYNGKPSGLVLVLDKTREKSYEKLFFTLSQINQLIMKVSNEQELLKMVCNMLVDKVGYLACAIGYIDENKLYRPIYIRAKTKELETAGWEVKIGVDEETPYGRGSISKAYHTKKVSLISEIFERPETSYWNSYYTAFNIHSACSIPILKKNRVKYILIVFDSVPNSFDKNHIHLLEELGFDLSFALEKIEAQKNVLVLNKAMALSHEWVIITDREGIIVDVNDTVCKISGHSKEELIGKSPRVFKSGYHDKTFYENLWKQILSGKICSCRFINKTKGGSIFYLDSNIIPIIQDNEIYRFVDISRDVTEIVKYQNQLEFKSKIYNTLYEISDLSFRVKTKEEFLKNLPEMLADNLNMDVSFIILKRDNMEIVYSFRKLSKYQKYLHTVEAMIDKVKESQDLYSFVPIMKSLKQKGIYVINKADSDSSHEVERQFVSYGFASCCAISIVLKGKVIGSLVLISTREYIFTKEVKELMKLIQNQIEFILGKFEDEKFSKITLTALNSGFEFVIVTDSNFNIVYVNDKTVKISGYSKEELVGKHHSIFSSKTHSKEFVKRFYDTLLSGKIYSGIMTYRAKNGSLKDFYVNITPFIENGKITHYIAVGKEVEKKDELLKELDKLLHYDSITGLMNIISFKEAIKLFIERAKHEDLIGAVAIINPIGFKRINEAFGFEIGNDILRQIAKRLTDNLRGYDRIGKLESDRFGILIKDLKEEEDILIVVSKVLSELTKPYKAENQEIFISFNIGLSLFPKDATSPETLLDKALVALTDAKSKGENQVGFFRKDIEREATKKLRLKTELELAIKNKEFVPYYQPYVDRSGKITGAEALMRWKKEGKVVSPGEFIEYLEQTYLIVETEDLIIDTVLQDLKSFKNPVPISINLSSQSLKQIELKDKLTSNINYYDIPGNLIRLEILERTLLNSFNYISNLIRELKQYNIYFSLDDFGTGYSSLSYLSKLDVEILKIDISFVRDLQNPKTRNIVGSIIYLAHSLGIRTTAEGVETQEQFETLKTMGCDYFQGYLFYKPMNKEEFKRLLE